MVKLIIDLPPVTKKNSNQIARTKDGRLFVTPSKRYKDYERDCGYFLKPLGIDTPVNVQALYYMPTHRKVDITNLHNALHDVLVKYGVVADDNSTIIAGTDGSRVLYDKENPRTEVIISEIADAVWMADRLKSMCLDTDDCYKCGFWSIMKDRCTIGVPSMWE